VTPSRGKESTVSAAAVAEIDSNRTFGALGAEALIPDVAGF